MNQQEKGFAEVCRHAREAMLLQTAADTLEWDERTGMPAGAGEYRADQVSKLRAITHRLRTDPRYGERLEQLAASLDGEDPHGDHAATVRGLRRDFIRDAKLPTELVEAISLATVRGQQAWDGARKANRFADFRDSLARVISLKREAGERLREGTDRDAYEALMDEYEPDARAEEIAKVFADLRAKLVPLIEAFTNEAPRPDDSCWKRAFPIPAQRELSRWVSERIGFDYHRGRLDETSHPFCTTLGPSDIRILTRYDERWLPGGLYGTLHEAGHGIYEQGLRQDWFGLPPGNYASLGIHESQSRLWENQVGRSREFWQWLHPEVRRRFPKILDDVSLEQMHRGVNRVEPSLIRVEADEATYNLHIIIRFELERQLLSGDLQVDDLPAAWNERYRSDLGISPPSDALGALQDVHWSAGLIGYFPTYTLGNLIAAQLFDAAKRAIGDLERLISGGDFTPLREWLAEQVHRHGRSRTPAEIVRQATGHDLTAEHLIHHLDSKRRALSAG